MSASILIPGSRTSSCLMSLLAPNHKLAVRGVKADLSRLLSLDVLLPNRNSKKKRLNQDQTIYRLPLTLHNLLLLHLERISWPVWKRWTIFSYRLRQKRPKEQHQLTNCRRWSSTCQTMHLRQVCHHLLLPWRLCPISRSTRKAARLLWAILHLQLKRKKVHLLKMPHLARARCSLKICWIVIAACTQPPRLELVLERSVDA